MLYYHDEVVACVNKRDKETEACKNTVDGILIKAEKEKVTKSMQRMWLYRDHFHHVVKHNLSLSVAKEGTNLFATYIDGDRHKGLQG